MTFSVVILVLVLAVIGYLFYLSQKIFGVIKDRSDFSNKNSPRDVENFLIEQNKRLKKVEVDNAELYRLTDDLGRRISLSLTKSGLVRFNPFADEGGNHSFSIALLNDENTGVVISNLNSRNSGSRIYAKPLLKGASEIALTAEEKEAIKKAR